MPDAAFEQRVADPGDRGRILPPADRDDAGLRDAGRDRRAGLWHGRIMPDAPGRVPADQFGLPARR
jgi:hypothetical protein